MGLAPRSLIECFTAFDTAAGHEPAIHIGLADKQYALLIDHHHTHAQRQRAKQETVDSECQIKQARHQL